MDIVYGDKMKSEIKLVLWYLKRKLKKEYDITLKEIEDDLDNCGNPVISRIWKEIKDAANKINETYQRNIALEFPMIALWIVYKDTAYNTPFMYIIKKIFDKKEELMPFIEKYYKEPDEWYVNRWHDTKEHTKELKKKGELPDIEGAMSLDEEIFVPKYQQKKIDMIDKEIKKKKRILQGYIE